MNVNTVEWFASHFSGEVSEREDGILTFTGHTPFTYTVYVNPDDEATLLDVDLSTVTANSIPLLKFLLSQLEVADCLYTMTAKVMDSDGVEHRATFNFYADVPAVDFTVEGEEPGSWFAVYEDSLIDDVKECLDKAAADFETQEFFERIVDVLTILADNGALSREFINRH